MHPGQGYIHQSDPLPGLPLGKSPHRFRAIKSFCGFLPGISNLLWEFDNTAGIPVLRFPLPPLAPLILLKNAAEP
jgi:hypothetical protein